MNKLLLLLLSVLLVGCDDSILNPVTTNINITEEQKVYKESIRNQRSGISFTWGCNESYQPLFNDRITCEGHYGNGHAYHDVNKDGMQDILVSFHKNDNSSELTWYINLGDNKRFSRSIEYFNHSTSGFNAHKILKTDVNNDGIADFIALGVDERIQNNYTGNFTVLIGKSNGSYDVNDIPNPQRYWFHNGAAGDINGDGNVDVIAATFIWYGDGKGNFIKREDYNLQRYSPLVYEIIDMNKDGWNDLIVRGPFIETTIIYNNKGIINENNRTYTLPSATYKAVMDIEVVDFDKDGDLDIVELAQLGGNPPDINDPKYFVSKITVYYSNNLHFYADETVIEESLDGNIMNGESDKYGWSVFKFDDIDKDGIDEILAENYHDGNYNVIKLVNSRWKRITFN
jgi:hypothetical protein